MNENVIKRHHAHMAELSLMGEHWHQKLWYGYGPWVGDRALNIYYNRLRNEVEVRYELPNAEPQMVFRIPHEDFSIYKLCSALAKADNRKVSVAEKMQAVDKHNDSLKTEKEKAEKEHREDTVDRIHFAMQQDLGAHTSPTVIP